MLRGRSTLTRGKKGMGWGNLNKTPPVQKKQTSRPSSLERRGEGVITSHRRQKREGRNHGQTLETHLRKTPGDGPVGIGGRGTQGGGVCAESKIRKAGLGVKKGGPTNQMPADRKGGGGGGGTVNREGP